MFHLPVPLTVEEVESLLSETFLLTPEKCKADAGYCHGDEDQCIAVQMKSATFKKDGKCLNIFHNTNNGYEGMLLFCRPMRRVYIGTLVMPGSIAPTNMRVFLSENTKYVPYIVMDVQLQKFMKDLYNAVLNKDTTFRYPSGIDVDISSLQLFCFDDLCIPTCKSDQKERENRLWRHKILPDFIYDYPRIQGTTVDVIINGVRIQDKIAFQRKQQNTVAFTISISKNGGRQGRNGKPKRAPYDVGDFDALFVFLNEQFFFLIPSKELETRGYLKSPTKDGKCGMTCYPIDYKPYEFGARYADVWTQQYCFDTSDKDVALKVQKLLETCIK